MNRYAKNRVAQVPERVSTGSFVVLIQENSKPNHLGTQGTVNIRKGRRVKPSRIEEDGRLC